MKRFRNAVDKVADKVNDLRGKRAVLLSDEAIAVCDDTDAVLSPFFNSRATGMDCIASDGASHCHDDE